LKPWALISGASRGIGAAVATELAAAGHPIILNFRSDEAAASAVKRQIEEIGQPAELARFDVCDRAATAEAISRLLVDDRPIGVVVNNAGVAEDGPFGAMSDDAWQRVIATTLDGFYNLTRPLIMLMVRRRWGRVINIASVSALHGNRGQVNYAAAKAGLIGATKSLALEVAKRGVTVNAVAPGLIETDMTAGLPLDRVLEHIPMRRIGRVEEVAKLVRFLASDDAAYITKQVIAIDGGLS
jgi:3-oxoacyl-[acyl-carrier protein] reductase